MAAFETLLHRCCEQSGVADDSRLLAAFEERDESPIQKAWRRWIQAQKAMRHGSPRLALAWLDAGGDLLDELDDIILRAEHSSTAATCWVWLDEPRDAVGPASAAWDLWSTIAEHPEAERIVPSARVLLQVLSEPHPPPVLSDEEILLAWMEDRMSLSLIGAAHQAMSVHAEFRNGPAAEEVAKTFLDWVERNLGAGPMSAYSGLLEARMLMSLGDVFDRCDDFAGALTTFEDGLTRLDGLPEIAEIQHLRGQLLFNGGNQLGKLARVQEALDRYVESEVLLMQAGDLEAALRCRSAKCVARFKLGDFAGLEDELAELAVAYEQRVEAAQEGSELITARQMLDRVYRLWLRIEADHLDARNADDVLVFLHLVFALKEEDGKFAGIWSQLREQAGRKLLSEVSVLIERAERRLGVGILVVEQVTDALLFVAIRPGPEHWLERFALQVVHDPSEIDAFSDLLVQHREVIDRFGELALPVRSEPSPGFVVACGRAWQTLSTEIRECIVASDLLMTCIDSQTELNQFPVELLHDGEGHLGLRKEVIRAPSLKDLNLLLCENRTNAEPSGTCLIVRADDDLVQADEETELVTAALESLNIRAELIRDPLPATLLARLGEGIDLLHYVGHGLADEIGEELPLGPTNRLPARAIEGLHPAPAPVTVLSACLTGRSRQLKTGHEQGFATQLLRRGSPAVVAALYLVPDRLAIEFAELLYYLSEDHLSAGVRDTRRALADDGCHPAAWASFVLFGSPDVRLTSPHVSDATTWPSASLRYLATGAAAHLELAQALLSQDEGLPPKTRQDVATDLRKLDEGDGDYFGPELLSAERDFGRLIEAQMVDRLLRLFGLVRHGRFEDHEQRARYERAGIAEMLTASQILGDTYLHIAAVVELRQRLLLPGEKNMDVLIASRRLHWLSGDDALLSAARSVVDP